MTVESTILRVAGYILSLPTEEQSLEVIRLKRYAKLYQASLSDEVTSRIEDEAFADLYRFLFPLVHQKAQQDTGSHDTPSVVYLTKELPESTVDEAIDATEGS
jgi:hypothetical protein